MKTGFFQTLFQAMSANENLYLLVGDLGFGAIEAFQKAFPQRFVNLGVAEQNMVGVAVGMALKGKRVFVYSIGNFPTFRCLEQIRNDVCYHRADVKIVCPGGGTSYGAVGATHHATQDIAILRTLPHLLIAAPTDSRETALITERLATTPGSAYLRLGPAGIKATHDHPVLIEEGTPVPVRDGVDAAFLVTGGVMPEALKAADLLADRGWKVQVFSVPVVKPLNRHAVLEIAGRFPALFTIEDHSIIGGLGGAVAEILAESRNHPLFWRIGFPDGFTEIVGDAAFLHESYGLGPSQIAVTVTRTLQEKG